MSSPGVADDARKRRVWILVWILASTAAAAVVASSFLLLRLLPRHASAGDAHLRRVAAIGDYEVAVAAQAIAQRSYAITRDPAYLATFGANGADAEAAERFLRGGSTAEDEVLLESVDRHHEAFLRVQASIAERVAAGDDAAARSLAFGAAETSRAETSRRLHELHDLVAAEARADVSRAHNVVTGMMLGLLGLSTCPAAAAYVLGRTFRRAEDAHEARRAHDRLAEQADEMRYRAHHDALTGLPNRALLLERLALAAEHGLPVVLLLLDVDLFQAVNDSLGHGVGDDLLKLLGERLERVIRRRPRRTTGEHLPPPDTVSRLGGDEFALLLVGLDEAAGLVVAERVVAACAQPLRLGGRAIEITASVGVVRADWSDPSADLVRDADVAMYQAKSAGGNRFTLFDPRMREALVDRFDLEAELADAVRMGALELHYQPIVDPLTATVDKLEALVRWRHPARGFTPPDVFIPLAEASGLIVPLGEWVLEEACRELRRLAPSHPGLRIAVNVSGRQLEEPGLVETVAAIVERTGIEPGSLVLEVTETVLMERPAIGASTLDDLRSLGLGLAIDDFGTGYSSLSRLRTLPVTELKIDKSFIDEIDDDEHAPVIAAIIALAHGIGTSVVAEGVETPAQLAALVRLGCDRVQGYLLSKPVPASGLREMLADGERWRDLVSVPEGAGPVDSETAAAMSAVRAAVADESDALVLVRPLLAELAHLTGLESTYLTRIDFVAGEQEILASHNEGGLQVPVHVRVPWEDTICWRALEGGPRVTSDVHADYSESAAAAELGMTGYAMAPVVDGDGAIIGTLCAATASGRNVDHATADLLNVFARLVANALTGQG